LLRFLQIAVPLLAAGWLAAGSHEGVVYSAAQPLPGATVSALRGDRRLRTTTDEAGRYEFKDLAPGVWRVEVTMFGFAPAHRDLSATGEPSTLEWNLELQPYQAAAPQPAPAPFPTIDVSATAGQEVSTILAAEPEHKSGVPAEPHEASEAFLVQGSLSRGLQAARPEDLVAERRADVAERVKAPLAIRAAAPRAPQPGASPGRAAAAGRLGGKGGFAARSAARKSVASFGNRRQRGQEGIHGAAYFTLRNSALDASPFSLTGQPILKPAYAHNRFGGMAGGPLKIPLLTSLRGTFFSLNYAGTRSRNPYHAVSTLPTLAERLGDFSESVVRGPLTLYDPATRAPFPGNRVPAGRMNRAALGLLEFIPAPNQPGQVQNYQFLTSIPQNTDNVSVRFNQSLSRRNRVSFSLNTQSRSGQAAQLFGYRDETEGSGSNLDLGWTIHLRTKLVSNFRVSLNRNRSETAPFFAYQRDVAAELGIQGTSHEPINYGPPNLNFTNFGHLSDASPQLRRDQTFGIHEGLTLVRGRHDVSLGADYRRTQLDSRTDSNARGSFSFSGLATSGLDARNQPLPFTGFDFADFLLGLPQSSSVRFGSAGTCFRGASWAVWAQDNWRVRPNLTVSAGLRYEFMPPLKEKHGRIANLDIAPGFTGAAVVTPGRSGPYSGRFPEALINADRNNLSPRVGLAWRPWRKRRVQVRAGYSAFFDASVYTRFATRLASQPPFANTAQWSTSLSKPLTLENGFPSAGAQATITNTFAVDRGYRIGYAQTWNLAVQQELPHALVAEIGYLGTKGTKLDVQRSPNRAAPGSPLTAEQRRLIGNATGFVFDSSEGNSIYHAAQVRLTRRFRTGFSANALYTFSKSIDNASSIGGVGSVVAQNDRDLRAERGPSSFDQRHVLNLFYLFTSPFDTAAAPRRGGPWLARFLRNWTLGGGLTLRTGQPLTARVLGNRADSGGTGVVGSGRADSTGDPVSGGRFFNLAAFTVPPAGRFGNAGRNTIPGPGWFGLNASLGRAFRLGESRRWLEARLESANATNHVNFTGLGAVINALNYGLPTATGPMRTLTATLRYRF
jgi:hypothetical protein